MRIVRGNPGADEIAALTAVLAALSRRGADRPAPAPRRANWQPEDGYGTGFESPVSWAARPVR